MEKSINQVLWLSIIGTPASQILKIFTSFLEENQFRVFDIGVKNIEEQLLMEVLIQVKELEFFNRVYNKFLNDVEASGATISSQFVDASSFLSNQNQHLTSGKFWVSAISNKSTPTDLTTLVSHLSEEGIKIEQMALNSSIDLIEAECFEFLVTCENKILLDQLKAKLKNLSEHSKVDFIVEKDNEFRHNYRLVCFDMDSTLIKVEVIDQLAIYAGVGDQVAAITARAMAGELDFKQSFAERMALLKGVPESALADIANKLPLTEGAELLISTLKANGIKTAILSGGFLYFAKFLQQKLGIDFVFANELAIEKGHVTGKVVGDVVDGSKKQLLLKQLAENEQILLDQVVAVGDGANDLPMLSTAGLGIAFHAKPIVMDAADYAISYHGLDSIIYLMGLTPKPAVIKNNQK